MTGHPSTFQLDLHAIGSGTLPVAEHVVRCEHCAAHVAMSTPTDAAPPSWALAPAARWRWHARWLLSAAATVASLAVVLATFDGPGLRRTTAKSLPSYEVFVAHGDSVERWDGHRPVETGDRLQLRISPAGYRWLLVATSRESGWQQLYQAQVSPSAATTLPLSWAVDADDSRVELGVLLCDARCDAADLPAAHLTGRRDAHHWFTRFTFERKQAP